MSPTIASPGPANVDNPRVLQLAQTPAQPHGIQVVRNIVPTQPGRGTLVPAAQPVYVSPVPAQERYVASGQRQERYVTTGPAQERYIIAGPARESYITAGQGQMGYVSTPAVSAQPNSQQLQPRLAQSQPDFPSPRANLISEFRSSLVNRPARVRELQPDQPAAVDFINQSSTQGQSRVVQGEAGILSRALEEYLERHMYTSPRR